MDGCGHGSVAEGTSGGHACAFFERFKSDTARALWTHRDTRAWQAMSIVKEGWVIKCGGSIKTWKKRWLVLRGNTLYYFKKKEDTQEQGSIRLEPGMVSGAVCWGFA